MLFDLRGRGRRRTVQVIYASLALLLGGGLVLFGIGGDVNGGLIDGITGNNSGSNNDQLEDQTKDARRAVKRNPNDARAWAVLMEREFQLAGQTDGFDAAAQDAGQPAFEDKARERLLAAERAWDRHLALAGDKPNTNAAGTARQLFAVTGLNKPDKAVRAEEILVESKPDPGFGDYTQLALAAYAAGQTRKGDLASAKAVELAPKDQKEAVKTGLEAQKAQATQQAAQGATGGASAPSPTP